MRKKKIKSTTLWFSIWSAICITYALFSKVNLSWWNGVAVALAGVIISYVGGNKLVSAQHGIETEEGGVIYKGEHISENKDKEIQDAVAARKEE